MQLPAETAAIFAWLHQGQFICADHPDPTQKRWFTILSDHFAEISTHFAPLGFRLEQQKHYFYLSQSLSSVEENERREKVLRFLDWLEIGLLFDPAFGPGYSIEVEEWELILNQQKRLLGKVRRLGFRGSAHTPEELLRLWLREMEKVGFIAQTHASPDQFRVLASLDYLIRFFQSIQIKG
ncbi:MAG: hypothetical protein AAFN10_04925 [Bacteroidota bacterium]